MYLCGLTEQFGQGSAVYKLHTNRPTWYAYDVPAGFERDQFEAIVENCFKRWSEVCNVRAQKHTNTKTKPTNSIVVADLGGRTPQGGQVLADQELPTKELLRMRINSRVKFISTDNPRTNGIDLGRTLTHEFGHFLGMLHFPDGEPAELMEARISHIIEPQPTEAAFAARLYGAPEATEPGTPSSRPKVDLEITDANGVRWGASGEMRRLT